MVHCWKRGDRHVVNIETTGRNRVLRGVPGEEPDLRRAGFGGGPGLRPEMGVMREGENKHEFYGHI